MDFRFSAEDEAFRQDIRAFVAAAWPGGTGDASVDSDEEYRTEREFEKKHNVAGSPWVGLSSTVARAPAPSGRRS